MINNTYLNFIFILFAICTLIFIYLNFKPAKNEINNKIVLKDLLESLDMELPDELKSLDNSSIDPQKLSQFLLKINLMSKFNFDDTETSGIWWSTNVAIRDLCLELKEETCCDDSEIVELLKSISESINNNGL